MATTRIIPLHQNNGRTVAECLTERTDYAKNPDKTNGGEYISSYECEPSSVDAEFLISKRLYEQNTGRQQESDVIAYQIRQSFKPGEITPELANRIGYELAMRFTKGEHAFIVATHVDKHHIHSHIIFNSTNLDCTGKFRNEKGSIRNVRAVSDDLCRQYGLSVVEKPARNSMSYNKWSRKNQYSQRDTLKITIDKCLEAKSKNLNELIRLIEQNGYTVTQTDNGITFKTAEMPRAIRIGSLGDEYSLKSLDQILNGKKKHIPFNINSNRPQLLTEIEKKINSDKGYAYEMKMKMVELETIVSFINELNRNENINTYHDLTDKISELTAEKESKLQRIRECDEKMKSLSELRHHITDYIRTKDTWREYTISGYSQKYYDEHENEIETCKQAKNYFNEHNYTSLPTLKLIKEEYEELQNIKDKAYDEYYSAKEKLKELEAFRQNYETITGKENEKHTQDTDKGKVISPRYHKTEL